MITTMMRQKSRTVHKTMLNYFVFVMFSKKKDLILPMK